MDHQGQVIWFNKDKGYGFIRPDETGTDLFVHFSQIDGVGFKELFEGDFVEYDIGERNNKPQAVNVHVIQVKTS